MFNELPYFVQIKGKEYKINVDFRHIIQIENIIKDRNIKDTEKICKCLELFYPYFFKQSIYILKTSPALFKEAYEKLKWFYKCGREDYHKSSGKGGKQRDIFSYEYDDEYIYGAFLERYNIDLSKDKIHWWKFKALLKSLSGTMFNEIQKYRSYNGKDKELLDLKEYWDLPISKAEKERLNKLYDMLK